MMQIHRQLSKLIGVFQLTLLENCHNNYGNIFFYFESAYYYCAVFRERRPCRGSMQSAELCLSPSIGERFTDKTKIYSNHPNTLPLANMLKREYVVRLWLKSI